MLYILYHLILLMTSTYDISPIEQSDTDCEIALHHRLFHIAISYCYIQHLAIPTLMGIAKYIISSNITYPL